ncbi:hypothetical protein [Hymenobacter volaticus]|uniref:Uncharacterized protein n=1 Tax=Hymenobacter volaticus TaxID=2932254 RepID=A0ABY4GEZ1_9BACT|nr:hypothetical protein [Hymenobacter volaticus]UOQ69365.1 hypothetical protein MUN86_27105 [Hymenobacter volaticus]
MMQEPLARFRHTLDRLADFGSTRQQTDLARESVNLARVLKEVREELAATGGQLVVEVAGPTPQHPWACVRC